MAAFILDPYPGSDREFSSRDSHLSNLSSLWMPLKEVDGLERLCEMHSGQTPFEMRNRSNGLIQSASKCKECIGRKNAAMLQLQSSAAVGA
jgi:hypothetical protein